MDIARASIKRSTVVLFVCLLIALGGVSAYYSIGKLEDPSFTIKTAVISIVYTGSTAYEAESGYLYGKRSAPDIDDSL